ncbi:MAG: glycosyltransferase [Alphaproteobacteria bacterium]|nr:glycosyltransferase [Alphaproteobacteria bacterium]
MIDNYIFSLISIILILIAFPFLDRFNPRHRTYLAFFAMVLFIRYIIWRTSFSIMMAPMPTFEGFWIWVCFVSEIFIFIETGTFYLLLCKHTHRSPAADRYEKILRALPHDMLPTVDVFIPTYNEGIDVVERSIVGALHLDWPKEKLKVWVLDDGKRDWLKDFCMQKGAGYIRRADNMHAKAGNINHASSLTNGKFIMTLDADFIPHRNFIYRTIGFFADPAVAIVQTPQHFFNKDFVQANLHLHQTIPDEQRLFFDVMMPARDGWGAAFWCGSSSIARRTAIEECGGIPTTSITEDLLTTLMLLRHKYTTLYLNEKLSQGIAPEELSGLMTQRERWCRGTIQAFYNKFGPLGPNLRFVHRILFFPTYWLFSPVTRIMAHMIPIVFLWTGTPSVYLDHYTTLLNYQLPILLFSFSYEMWVMPRHFVPLINTASNTLNAIQVLPTVINSLFSPRAKGGFGVTPKGRFGASEKKYFYHPYSFWMCFILLALTIGGIVINMLPGLSATESDAFFPIAATWAIFNALILLIMVFLSIEHPKRRQEERFQITHPSTLVTHEGIKVDIIIDDLSLSGAQIQGNHLAIKNNFIYLDIDGMQIPAKIVHCSEKNARLQFIDLTLDQRDHLIRFLFTGRFDNAPKPQPVHVIGKHLLRRIFGKHKGVYTR